MHAFQAMIASVTREDLAVASGSTSLSTLLRLLCNVTDATQSPIYSGRPGKSLVSV